MTRKLFVVWMALAAVLLAGCATTGGSGTPPAPDAQAKRLAAKLEGNAKVDGTTVTLTGEVYLTTSLTVPAGVTLDLTAEGAKFALRDGAVLTVDGEVKTSGHGEQEGKGWVDGGLRIGDGATVINGSGTIRLKSKGRLLNIWGGDGKRHLTLEGVTLVGIADNDSSLVEVSNGGEMVMKSGVITGNTRNTNPGPTSTSGGGVQVYNGGTFTMIGGEISGNSAFHGSGVNVRKGTFTMEGGTISGNTARNSTVSVGEGSTFTMKSGAITGNEGRGVHVSGKTTAFIMEGGEISGNSPLPGAGAGQGVAVHGGAFTIKGGVIHGNTSREGGGVVVWEDGLFEMVGGRIQGNRDSDGFTRNTSTDEKKYNSALHLIMSRSRWGTGGTYTIDGVSQTGGVEILPHSKGTNDTLIAIPGK